jgi:hypothetical protein
VKVETLNPPYSIESFHDGGLYEFSMLPPLTQTNLFLRIGIADGMYIKVPSERGFEDYRKFVKLGQSGQDELRPLEPAERFERLKETLASLPDLEPLTSIGTELAHYVAIHKLQYERLVRQDAVRIPLTRFATLQTKRWGFVRKIEPAFFQERIAGTTLWNMFDFEKLNIKPQWRTSVPAISAQLAKLLNNGLERHIDWNIQNFVFDEAASQLFYVDLKPTTFVAKQSNEQNLRGIRQYYLV